MTTTTTTRPAEETTATELRRVCKYGDRVIVTDGETFGAFWTAKKYPTLDAIKAAIDDGTAYDGIYLDAQGEA